MSKFETGQYVLLVANEESFGMNDSMHEWKAKATPLKVYRASPQRLTLQGPGGMTVTVKEQNVRPLDKALEAEIERKLEKEIKEAKAEASKRIPNAKKLLKDESFGSNGVAVHLKEGEPARVSTGPCHGFIRNQGTSKSQAIVTLIDRSGDGRAEGQVKVSYALPLFYDWLFNRSPWAFCWETKDAVKALYEGSAVARVDVPANMLQGALITSRNTWEHPRCIKVWHSLVVEHNMDENLAFLASMYSMYDEADQKIYPTAMSTDHLAIDTHRMTRDGVRHFLAGDPLKLTRNYNKGGEYNGVTLAFEGKGEALYEEMKREFDNHAQEKSLLNLNPFSAAKPKKMDRLGMSIKKYADFAQQFFTQPAK